MIGVDRLKALNKKVGEHFTVHSINYKDIDLDVEIIGALPPGRYGQSAVMNCQYLNDALNEDYPRTHNGAEAPAGRQDAQSRLAAACRTPRPTRRWPTRSRRAYADSTPSVKCETASSGVASFLDAYRDLLWGMEYLFTPIALASMAVVIATAISISVRERRTEMAILKVLGFGPWRILLMVLGEGLLVGAGSGLLSVAADVSGRERLVRRHPVPDRLLPGVQDPGAGLRLGSADRRRHRPGRQRRAGRSSPCTSTSPRCSPRPRVLWRAAGVSPRCNARNE